MSRCGLCRHPDSNQLDALYISNKPLRAIVAAANANPTGPHVSLGQAHRHKAHVRELIRERLPVERQEHGTALFERVQRLVDEAEGILVCAKSSQDWKAATAAIGAATRLLELCGRLTGELQSNSPGIHLTLNKTTHNTTINNFDTDLEFAQLIGEGTRGFSVDELMRLKSIAEQDERGLAQPAVINKPLRFNE